ncbi:MAG TPA: hypothetical protein VF072_17240 [Thermoleophilaceae bacterium]
MGTLLGDGAAAELQAGAEAERVADPDGLTLAAYRVDHAAAFLAELNAAARARPASELQARAEALDQEIARTWGDRSAPISAHAFAVHELTGVYGSGGDAVRTTMLRFVATDPPHERATLQASKVAALLSDALGRRARMALLDHIILALGPLDGDPSIRVRHARDSALVLILLDGDAAAPGGETTVVFPTTAEKPADAPSDADAGTGGTGRTGAIAEIVAEAERATADEAAERQARYERAVDAGSLAGALAVVRDAAAAEDHEQAWSFLEDTARRHPDADPGDLVTVAPDVLGPIPLDGDGAFDGPGAGTFTVLSPAPGEAAAAMDRIGHRLLLVDENGTEHADIDAADASGAYTPNYLHDIAWCDRGVTVMLDTKGVMSAPMARTMIGVITRALVEDRVPALVTGWTPALDDRMTRWEGER